VVSNGIISVPIFVKIDRPVQKVECGDILTHTKKFCSSWMIPIYVNIGIITFQVGKKITHWLHTSNRITQKLYLANYNYYNN
jgi:hypothetical protein